MISKVLPAARSFRACCQYVCQDQTRAQVLKTQGVRGHDYSLMAKDFEFQRSLRPDKHQAVFHSVLSIYPGEKPTDKKVVEIAEQCLDRIGIINTQFVIAKQPGRQQWPSNRRRVAGFERQKGGTTAHGRTSFEAGLIKKFGAHTS
jgi:hypothetical protein